MQAFSVALISHLWELLLADGLVWRSPESFPRLSNFEHPTDSKRQNSIQKLFPTPVGSPNRNAPESQVGAAPCCPFRGLGFVDNTHPALADLLEDLVVGDGGIDPLYNDQCLIVAGTRIAAESVYL